MTPGARGSARPAPADVAAPFGPGIPKKWRNIGSLKSCDMSCVRTFLLEEIYTTLAEAFLTTGA